MDMTERRQEIKYYQDGIYEAVSDRINERTVKAQHQSSDNDRQVAKMTAKTVK